MLLGFFYYVFLSQVELFFLPLSSQLLFFFTLLLGLLYCLPLPGLKINFRGFKGLKIHLVALSWVLMTSFYHLLRRSVFNRIFFDVWLSKISFCISCYFTFRNRDLKLDHPNLSTWPQRWGVKNTKILGFVLLIFSFFRGII